MILAYLHKFLSKTVAGHVWGLIGAGDGEL